MNRTALTDIAAAVITFTAVYFGAQWLGLPGPGTLALLITLAVATWRLAASAHGWSGAWASVGLRAPDSWWRLLLWVIAIYVLVILTNVLLIGPRSRAFGWPPLDLSRFEGLRGNPMRLALWLLVAWTTAAIAEELVFRGFLLTRIQALIGPSSFAAAAAVVLQAVLFAAGHAYLGIRGVVTSGVVALVFGAVYCLNGRQLVPLMLAHGLIDSVSLLTIFAGAAELAG